ncbi:MAG: hypothetical protein OEW72_09670, partial [Gammaproteobacteria bacterium]|nr:hypothetical protein [Gammaproteobacteria bacterium]
MGYHRLARDPFELRNIAPTLALDLLQRLHAVLQANMSCTGARACQDAARQGPWRNGPSATL